MDDIRIRGVIESTDEILSRFQGDLRNYTSGIRSSVRDDCAVIRDEVSFRIASLELHLVRTTVVLSRNAQYHILSAYFHASPGLWAILLAIYAVVTTVIEIVSFINELLKVVTGETLAFWVDKLVPGFQAAWNDIMNKISEFSATLGWGVDGVGHLLNAFDASANMWGMVTGKTFDGIKYEKYTRMKNVMDSYSTQLASWESSPGAMIAHFANEASEGTYWQGHGTMVKIVDSIGSFGDKAELALKGMGTITSELLGIRNDMPAVVAKNIPPGIWNALDLADTAINDRILPALTHITDRLDELDAVLDSYREKAAEIADRLLHPGDLLSEIDKLPDYARQNQLVKIDGVTSALMKESNEAAFAALEGDLTIFAKVAAALKAPPAPLAFMELELPGRSPGITGEPRETWILTDGDY